MTPQERWRKSPKGKVTKRAYQLLHSYKESKQRWYKANWPYHAAYGKVRRKRWKDLILQPIYDLGCQECSGTAVDLHHYQLPKVAAPSELLYAGQYIAFVREMKKCKPVCRSCHRGFHPR